MKRFLIAGAIALMAGPAFAGGATRDFAYGVRLPSSAERTDAVVRATLMRRVEKHLDSRAATPVAAQTTISQDGMSYNYNSSMAIGNWSNVSCSGDGGYCNVGTGQKNDDSSVNAQVNTGENVGANQIGGNQKNGGGYVN